MTRKGRRTVAWTMLGSFAVIPLCFGMLFLTNNLGGPSLWSRVDGDPTSEEVDQWQIHRFDSTGWKAWNVNPNFEACSLDTGPLADTLVSGYLGKQGAGWGFQLYGWGESRNDNRIMVARAAAQDGEVYVHVRQDWGGQYGNGALIQGWNWWGGDGPDPVWRCPRPLAVNGKRLVASVELTVEHAEVLGSFFRFERWLMVALTFWFRSSELQKPLVIDLAIRPRMNMMFSRESDDAYHYQRVVVRDITEAEREWRHYDLDLSWFIDDALTRYGITHAKGSLTLTSMEALIETRMGDAAFRIRHFAVYYRNEKR